MTFPITTPDYIYPNYIFPRLVSLHPQTPIDEIANNGHHSSYLLRCRQLCSTPTSPLPSLLCRFNVKNLTIEVIPSHLTFTFTLFHFYYFLFRKRS